VAAVLMVDSAEEPTRPAGLRTPVRRLALAGRTHLSGAMVWAVVPLLIVLLCWHALALQPKPGLDSSWEGALHMALHDHITFGNHLIFTYGPLGFLSVPTLWYSDTGSLAALYAVLLRFALASALFLGARRTYGTVAGALIALLVADASEVALEAVPFLVLCVWMVDHVSAARQRLTLMATGGAVAGLELLNRSRSGLRSPLWLWSLPSRLEAGAGLT
jgi:hypothetical protein